MRLFNRQPEARARHRHHSAARPPQRADDALQWPSLTNVADAITTTSPPKPAAPRPRRSPPGWPAMPAPRSLLPSRRR